MLSNQFVMDSLYQNGLWQNENTYFLVEIVKPAWKTALEFTNYWANLLSKKSYAIINKGENGIAILPLNLERSGFIIVPELACLIPNEDVQSVEFKKSFMSKKLIIKTNSGKPSSFIVESKNGKILHHEQNLIKFMSFYS